MRTLSAALAGSDFWLTNPTLSVFILGKSVKALNLKPTHASRCLLSLEGEALT